MLLIDTRTPPFRPEPERAAWEPNWRLWAWLALTLAAVVGARLTAGLLAYGLICAALAFGCRALTVALPYTLGLHEHRQ